jgi:alkylation response protein AidB-like acyl-CoA dehydrogenase
MDLHFTEEQEMLRRTARDFLANNCPKELVRAMEEDDKGYSPELWRKMAELGWFGLIFPEKYGGTEGGFFNLVVLLEEMGRFLVPSPFIPTVVLGGLTILEAGSEEQKQQLLPKIITGELRLTLAITEPSAGYSPASVSTKATVNRDDYEVSGIKLFVTDFHIADYAVCATRTDEGISLFLVDTGSPGINRTPLLTIAGDKQFEVTFDRVMVPKKNLLGEPGKGWEIIERVLRKAAVAKCAEMSGMAQQVFEMSVSYAKERKQFDRPIGSFQAIQHYCANMVMDVDTSRFLTYLAAWMIDSGLPCSKEVSAAKAWVSQACRRVMALGHQIHGGIGVTLDHDMQLYYRRAKAAELAFGDADFHKELVAQELGL